MRSMPPRRETLGPGPRRIGCGVITYTANGRKKVAVAIGFTMLAWPTKIVAAKIEILSLEGASANHQ